MEKVIGGSDVCLTCECHCAHIEELEAQIGHAKSFLSDALRLIEENKPVPSWHWVIKSTLDIFEKDTNTIYDALKAAITTRSERIKTALRLLNDMYERSLADSTRKPGESCCCGERPPPHDICAYHGMGGIDRDRTIVKAYEALMGHEVG